MSNNKVKEGDVIVFKKAGEVEFYARIEDFEPDPKPDWFKVIFLVLTAPKPMIFPLKLRIPQINGEEFTLGGIPCQIEKLPVYKVKNDSPEKEVSEDGKLIRVKFQ
jgi:hypothetical protein